MDSKNPPVGYGNGKNVTDSSPTPPSIDTLLQELVREAYYDGVDAGGVEYGDDGFVSSSYTDDTKSQLLTLFESIMLEVIGRNHSPEDVADTVNDVVAYTVAAQNSLMDTQRKRAAAALERLRNV